MSINFLTEFAPLSIDVIEKAVMLSVKYDGIADLLDLLKVETNPNERALIAKDITELVRDCDRESV